MQQGRETGAPRPRVVGFVPGLWAEAYEEALRTVAGLHLLRLENSDDVARHAAALEGLVTAGNEASYSSAIAAILQERAVRLKWIQLTTAGYDAIECNGMPAGTTLTGNGGGFDRPVAEHAMALLLGLSHRLHVALDGTARPRWDRKRTAPALGLDGRCLLIVGLGGIGREIALRARAFGMKVIGVTRSGRPDPAADTMVPVSELAQVLPQADAIALCTPLTEETRHLMNAERLALCREGAILVNVGRGGLVDTPALVEALHSGWLGGAGLDVTEPEPLPDDHPLWQAPNVIVTPHVAPAGSLTATAAIARHIAENATRFVTGQPLAAQIRMAGPGEVGTAAEQALADAAHQGG